MFAAYLRSTLVPTHVSLPLNFRKPGGLIVNTLWRNRGRYLCDPFFDHGHSLSSELEVESVRLATNRRGGRVEEGVA